MNLIMQNIGGVAQVLPNNDNVVFTGHMGDCVSVVVLYNRNPNGQFTAIRGFHGLGGIGAVNLNSLLLNVPNNNTTHIFIIPGNLNQGNYLGLEDALERINQTHALATTIQYEACGSALIYRNGNVARNPNQNLINNPFGV